MASLDSIHLRLKLAANLLDAAATEIRDAEFEPRRENIENIGRALVEIFEIQHRIHDSRPDLKPEHLNESSPHPEADGALARCMYTASEFEIAGQPEQAIEVYREFMALDVPTHHKDIAAHEISRLSQG